MLSLVKPPLSATGIGVLRSVVVPSPSWPELLDPQQYTVPCGPAPFTTHVWLKPADIEEMSELVKAAAAAFTGVTLAGTKTPPATIAEMKSRATQVRARRERESRGRSRVGTGVARMARA